MGTIAVAWWNLENLFDTDDDPISQDFEFTKAMLNQLHGGNGPELLGVAEVEGDDVFAQLLADTGNPHLKVATDPNPPTPTHRPTCAASTSPSPTTTASSKWSTRPPSSCTCATPPATSSRSSSRSSKPTTGWWSSPATGHPADKARSTANPPA